MEVAMCPNAQWFIWHCSPDHNPTALALINERKYEQQRHRTHLSLQAHNPTTALSCHSRGSLNETVSYCTDRMILLALNTVNTDEGHGKYPPPTISPHPHPPNTTPSLRWLLDPVEPHPIKRDWRFPVHVLYLCQTGEWMSLSLYLSLSLSLCLSGSVCLSLAPPQPPFPPLYAPLLLARR